MQPIGICRIFVVLKGNNNKLKTKDYENNRFSGL